MRSSIVLRLMCDCRLINSNFSHFPFFLQQTKKSHPPKLNYSVHRLEIAKVYAERLEKKDILTMEHFLKALNKDPCNLAKVNLTFFLLNLKHFLSQFSVGLCNTLGVTV
jgi:hypothetical protein